jgi:hypothetical protein
MIAVPPVASIVTVAVPPFYNLLLSLLLHQGQYWWLNCINIPVTGPQDFASVML